MTESADPDDRRRFLEAAYDLARKAGVDLSPEQAGWVAQLGKGDWDGEPHRLVTLLADGTIDLTVLMLALPGVWGYKTERCSLPNETWLELFRSLPFTVDSIPSAAPTTPRRLYRGAREDNTHGLAWTRNLQIATNFAYRVRGQVRVCWVPPDRILARITGEEEYVVDARGLTVKPVQPYSWLETRRAAYYRRSYMRLDPSPPTW